MVLTDISSSFIPEETDSLSSTSFPGTSNNDSKRDVLEMVTEISYDHEYVTRPL